MIDPQISKWYSEISKQGHKKNPRPKEYYQKIQRKSVIARAANRKLSTGK